MRSVCALAIAGLFAASSSAFGADPGVTATSIKLGNTMPYSGPASAYSAIGKAQAAYFKMRNDRGGINGRSIDLVSVDDGYAPPKTVEQTRKLVEQDEVFAMFGSLGTAPNIAVHKYLNDKGVPQILPYSGSSRWNDAKHFPWTTGSQPTYFTEGAVYGRWIVQTMPTAKIAVITPNDDAGRDYLRGFRAGLGDHAGQIVTDVTYTTSDPSIDSQILQMHSAGADVVFNECTPKFAAMALKKIFDLGWKPQIILPTVSNSVSAVIKVAGLEASKGIVTGAYLKDPTDKTWANDPDMRDFLAWMGSYNSGADPGDIFNVSGYVFAEVAAREIEMMGADITRANLMKQTQSLTNVTVPMLLPGITINTSADNVVPVRQLQMARFDGASWVLFGEVLGE